MASNLKGLGRARALYFVHPATTAMAMGIMVGGAPYYYLVGFDKTFLALPRMLHFLALAYFLSTQGWVERHARSGWMAPFALQGRYGLAVFATGSVLSRIMQAVKVGIGRHLASDALLLGSGLAVQFTLAYALRRTAQMRGGVGLTVAFYVASRTTDLRRRHKAQQ